MAEDKKVIFVDGEIDEVCPYCGAQWGVIEMDEQFCSACGYPHVFDEDDDHGYDLVEDEENVEGDNGTGE